ncbi:MAG: hypothetical protein IJ071_05030 [Ruminococcus sp.]|nr:hypothetical protein [Ruminococcus sp.]
MKAFIIIIMVAALAALVLFAAELIRRSRLCTKVLCSPDAKEVMADVTGKEVLTFSFYWVTLEFSSPDGTKTVNHIFSRNYIDNYRPEQVPVVYSARLDKTATKGSHELKVFHKSLLPLILIFAAVWAAGIYNYVN